MRLGAGGLGIRTTTAKLHSGAQWRVIIARHSFTGSIVHSLRICEENYREIGKYEKFGKMPGELKAKPRKQHSLFVG